MTVAPTDCTGIAEKLARFGERFDESFARVLAPPSSVPAVLAEAMRYSALAPGKRIRPYLAVRCCELVGGTFDDALGSAAAIECVHAFSLVHDDLPAMDDDDLRRGRPTNHKKFGEATAILAGDGLIALAFELIVVRTPDATRAARMVAEVARGAGWAGMIGGQVADIQGEQQAPDRALVDFIHDFKTARLLATACRIGTLAGGGDEEAVERLGEFGRQIGLAFQVADDLLDETSTSEVMGKAVGKDATAGKQTYPRCVGVDESRRIGAAAVQSAIAALAPFGDRADDLRQLAAFCMERTH